MSHAQIDPRTLVGPDRWSADHDGCRLEYGDGTLERLGAVVRDLGCRHVLLVTDRGLERAGHAAVARRSLERADLAVTVFDDVLENPTTEHVEAGRRVGAAASVDGIVGLGGGSAMDCAKGVNFLLTNGGRMEDYRGRGLARQPMLPAVGVPTTAGTGSEAQSFALISNPETHEKMACGDRKARFRAVLLDPTLLASVPRDVAAVTGVDAVTHAVESHVSSAANPLSRLWSREAWRLLEVHLEPFLADPSDAAARRGMLLGAHFAGAAIERSMLGAAHACANPLTARHGVTHGRAVGTMLPHVVRFNAFTVEASYADLAGSSDALLRRLAVLLTAAGIDEGLSELGIAEGQLDALATEAATQWTAGFNPRAVDAADLRGFYAAAF